MHLDQYTGCPKFGYTSYRGDEWETGAGVEGGDVSMTGGKVDPRKGGRLGWGPVPGGVGS